MRLQSFFENIAQLQDAPNGLSKLRQLIVQLAIEGKLVAQVPSDEPASALLERVTNGNNQTKRLSRRKTISSASVGMPVPFGVPPSWEWTSLFQVGHEWGQKKPDIDFTYIDVASIDNARGVIGADLKLLKPNEAPSRARKIVKRGSIIYSTVRPYLLNIAIVNKEYSPEPIASTAFAVIHPYHEISADYLFYYLRSRTFINFVEEQMQGVAYPAINGEKLFTAPVPIPPSKEQERIVNRVNELMRLCDELEVQHKAKCDSRLRLNTVVLAPLNKAASLTSKEFEQATTRLADNFDMLYDSIDTVSKLRSTILQLAVHGKLIAQDPHDKSASIRLSRKWEETNQITNTQSAHSKELECPFRAPRGWQWAPLGGLGVFFGGGTPSKSNPSFWQGTIPWVSPKDMKKLYVSDTKDHISEQAVQESTVRKIPVGSLLMVVRGMILAHSFPVALTRAEVTINQDMKALVFAQPELSEYVLLACRGLKDLMLSKVARSSHGTCRLDTSDIESFLIPIPPLAEQKRIVTKVNQLMSLCDELEAKLRQAEADSERLMNAAVKHVLDTVRDASKTAEEVFA